MKFVVRQHKRLFYRSKPPVIFVVGHFYHLYTYKKQYVFFHMILEVIK